MSRITTIGLLCVLVSAVLLVSSCARPPAEVQEEDVAAQKPAAPLLHSVITTMSESDGQVLIEIPLGRDHGLQAGTLIRVFDAEREGYMKGMLQVLSVPEAELSLARQIGLMDRNNPLRVGDPLVVINDIRELNVHGAVSRQIQQEVDEDAQREGDVMSQFDQLRAHFQAELSQLQEQQAQTVREMQEEHERSLQDQAERHERSLQRLRSEHLLELSAVREALADEAVSELRRDRDARRAEIQRLSAENARLQDSVEGLSRELQLSEQRLQQMREQQGEQRRSHEREIRAELETREILEQRIRELEVRLGLPGSRAPAVLVGDVGREETVLARLDRISRERNELLREVDALQTQISAMQNAQENDDSPEAAALRAQQGHLDETISRNEVRLQSLRARLVDLDLRRLQAERNYFDLASRVLRLPGSSPSLEQVQNDLRSRLSSAPEIEEVSR